MRRRALCRLLCLVVFLLLAAAATSVLLWSRYMWSAPFWRPHAIEVPAVCISCPPVANPSIPRIIHQTWKTAEIPKQWARPYGACRYVHRSAEWTHVLWTDEAARNFIAEKHPAFLPTFDSYPHPIQRVDAVRYFILYEFGGVYMDLDIGCTRSLEPLLKYPAVVPKTEPIGFSNDFMMASPRHPFFKQLIDALPHWNRWFLTPYATVFFSTGPMFLNLQLGIYYQKHPQLPEHKHTLEPPMDLPIVLGSKPTNITFPQVPDAIAADTIAAAVDPAAVWVMEPWLYAGPRPYSFFVHFEGSSWHTDDAKLVFVLWGLLSRPWLIALLVAVSVWWCRRRRINRSPNGSGGSSSSILPSLSRPGMGGASLAGSEALLPVSVVTRSSLPLQRERRD
ncbi:nucleotide-diphospho-sugar transferase [Entophlyctis helioformis]|nr:nucleotide-diphospho-sugar transferase [Entophlyctis helioformis]